MMFYIFILIITTFISTEVYCRPPSKIKGGSQIKITDRPFVVQIRKNETKFYCGGTLITKQHILTAAHCVTEEDENKNLIMHPISWYSIVAGETYSNAQSKHHQIERIDIHPEYKTSQSNEQRGDIAVITLKEEIEVNEYQKPIALATSPPKPKSIVTALGWGISDTNTDQLKETTMMVFDRAECKALFTPRVFPPDQFCVQKEPGVSVCNGDSGGPVYFNDEVVGIIAYAENCSGYDPNYITNVHQYKSWIEEAIKGVAPTLSVPLFSQ